jgi:ribonucleotide reductase alpha subunit
MKFSIKKLIDEKKVYDIQVKNRHTFTVTTSHIVVHNCFLSYVPDTLEGLIAHSSELKWLAVMGGGVGGHWGDVRAVSDKAPGPIPFIHTVDADMEAYKQGRVRRGSYAAYMDISHPDIIEFLNIRIPAGDAGRKCHSAGFHHGLNITDKFMDAVLKNQKWDLCDPHDSDVRETVQARALWEQILETRYRTGEPYLYFIDAANRALPKTQKDLGLRSYGSNLCLTGDTLISIKIENQVEDIRLDDFTEKYSFGFYANGVEVKSYDTELNEVVWTQISNAAKTAEVNELIEIDYEGHIIQCTPEHKILTTTRGWVEAQNLEETDNLVL